MDRLRPCFCQGSIGITVLAAANVINPHTAGGSSSAVAGTSAGGKARDRLCRIRLYLYISLGGNFCRIGHIGTGGVLLYIHQDTGTYAGGITSCQGCTDGRTRRSVRGLHGYGLILCRIFLLFICLVDLCPGADPGLRIRNADIQCQGACSSTSRRRYAHASGDIQCGIGMLCHYRHTLSCVHYGIRIDIGLRHILGHAGIHGCTDTGILCNSCTTGNRIHPIL